MTCQIFMPIQERPTPTILRRLTPPSCAVAAGRPSSQPMGRALGLARPQGFAQPSGMDWEPVRESARQRVSAQQSLQASGVAQAWVRVLERVQHSRSVWERVQAWQRRWLIRRRSGQAWALVQARRWPWPRVWHLFRAWGLVLRLLPSMDLPLLALRLRQTVPGRVQPRVFPSPYGQVQPPVLGLPPRRGLAAYWRAVLASALAWLLRRPLVYRHLRAPHTSRQIPPVLGIGGIPEG